MVVDDEPVIATLDVREAVARRPGLALSVLDIGERVIAGIDRCTVVYADQLIAEGHFEAWKRLEGGHEIIPQGRPTAAHRRGQGPPEHGVISIVRQYLVGIVFT